MSEFVTPEIIRRFMIALGGKEQGLCVRVPQRREGHSVDIRPNDLDAISLLAFAFGQPSTTISARLATCAAAERLLDHGRFIRSNNPKMEPTDSVALIAAVVEVHGEGLLKQADVDPKRWGATL